MITEKEVASFVGKPCVIIDKVTKKCVAGGIIDKVKLNPVLCVSFDNVHFFSINEKNNVLWYVFDSGSDYYDVTELKIPEHWKVALWRSKTKENKMQSDIYIERDELDKEIKKLVIALNRVKGLMTGGSCSGHGHSYPFVSIIIRDLAPLNFLLRCQHIYRDSFDIGTNEITSPNYTKDQTVLTLSCRFLGEKAYGMLDSFAEFIISEAKKEDILLSENEIVPIFHNN